MRERMNNNDVVRRLRYALNLNDDTLKEIFKISGYNLTTEEIKIILKKEGEEGFVILSNDKMNLFLDGFITYKRGAKDDGREPVKEALTNNVIFRKLRIALNLRGEEVLEIMRISDPKVSSSEVSAIFRKKDHRNFKPCGDRYIRNFLKGLTKKYRG